MRGIAWTEFPEFCHELKCLHFRVAEVQAVYGERFLLGAIAAGRYCLNSSDNDRPVFGSLLAIRYFGFVPVIATEKILQFEWRVTHTEGDLRLRKPSVSRSARTAAIRSAAAARSILTKKLCRRI